MASLRQDPDVLEQALARAVERGTLLRVEVTLSETTESLYFINAEPGREALELIARGEWKPGEGDLPVEILPERPNIYRLYEENIGPLTPLIAETLRDAETEYPVQWIADAIRVAVENNAAHWNFVRAVLQRWKKEGRRSEIAERSDESTGDGERYVSGKYADFIEH
jgi:DnaD/phage-associated family protein